MQVEVKADQAAISVYGEAASWTPLPVTEQSSLSESKNLIYQQFHCSYILKHVNKPLRKELHHHIFAERTTMGLLLNVVTSLFRGKINPEIKVQGGCSGSVQRKCAATIYQKQLTISGFISIYQHLEDACKRCSKNCFLLLICMWKLLIDNICFSCYFSLTHPLHNTMATQ